MKKNNLPWGIDFLSSHGLTIIALLFLMVITIVGTIDQKYIGLFQSQKKYFESVYFNLELFQVGRNIFFIPFPGGYSILSVLFVNLVLAFIFKFRWRLHTVGVLVCHIGLLMLLIGSYLTYAFSIDGYLSFFEKEQKGYFTSYHYNEIALKEFTPKEQEVKVGHDFLNKGANFKSSEAKIRVQVEKYFRNCKGVLNNDVKYYGTLQEYALQEATPEPQNENNASGAYVKIFNDSEEIGSLYLYENNPVVFNYNGYQYNLTLQKQIHEIPFSLELVKFTRELYPGTQTPKHYESQVKLIEDNNVREILISMNRPLRHHGYTFYQSSFAQTEQGQYQSTLAVMANPAEKWPYISCLLVVLGMIFHFFPKLLRFAKRQTKEVNNQTA